MKKYKNILAKSKEKLDELNQKIWDNGFNSLILTELDVLAKEINDGATIFERIPQEQLSGLSAR